MKRRFVKRTEWDSFIDLNQKDNTKRNDDCRFLFGLAIPIVGTILVFLYIIFGRKTYYEEESQ